ncbi:MAG: radical SAM protein, partial [Gammaproteobacteria bacterium]|nr:radical SAM protein [Gammaproteobacteria bacterium]
MPLLYDQPLFRPPSEGDNLIIQATLGCSFNQCSFCAMYRSKQYVARPLAEVIADIRTAATDWPDAQRVFLADGDALALPTDHLLAILRELAASFPRLTRVSCYATPGNLARI